MIPKKIAASIMCADPFAMGKDIEQLEKAGVEYLHCDIMDGRFVPNLMLSTEIVNAAGKQYKTPLDIHLMVERPENVLPWYAMKAGDVVSVHFESTQHVQRVLSMIRKSGATPALALNPATPLECIREVLPDIGMLLLMTVNPGYAAQRLVPETLNKICRARRMLDELGYDNMPIEVDGNCSLENIPKMLDMGADVFVVGSSSVFDPRLGIEKGVAAVRALFPDPGERDWLDRTGRRAAGMQA